MDEPKAYGIYDLETGEKRVIFLRPSQFENAYDSVEVRAYLAYLNDEGAG